MHTQKPFYITTTIPYVNADPHVGFALEIVQADMLARYYRLMEREVFFSTGSDEYGQKIWEAAKKENIPVQDYVDQYAERFEDLKKTLNLSYDNFIRTTSADHIHASQEFWNLCQKKGDIYKKKYSGLYCVGCELFIKEKDLVLGKCPNHPNQVPQQVEEENYFFKLSNYQTRLIDYLEQKDRVVPEWRRLEALEFVKNGLEDFSISRSCERLSWGVPVPGDDTQVMYVWFAAFVNYISTLGWFTSSKVGKPKDNLFEKFWTHSEVIQVAGKDQVRFQSIMWQAMLMSADIKITDCVLYHGFINSGGQKMSKSLGNVIHPVAIVNEYGTDALRYYLLRHIHPFDDSDMTIEKFKEVYNANLANGLGNLASRLLNLGEKYLESAPSIPEQSISEEWKKEIEDFRFDRACDIVWRWIGELDQEIAEKEPFKLAKVDLPRAQDMLREMLVKLYTIARMLNPIMPETSATLKELIKANKKPTQPLFLRKE